jgi:hypothetical protein
MSSLPERTETTTMNYYIDFRIDDENFEHGAVPIEADSIEHIPNVGDQVEFNRNENEGNDVFQYGPFTVKSRTFSYGFAGTDKICFITIYLKVERES